MEDGSEASVRVMAAGGMFIETVPTEEFGRDTVVINEWALWALLIACGWPHNLEEDDDYYEAWHCGHVSS